MKEITEFLIRIWQGYFVHFIDIAIIGYVFYKVMLLIKGTRTEQVTRGLVILLMATFAARLLRLQATGWILQRFWLAGMVALVVVFQPELRNLLAQLGRGRISKFFFKEGLPFINDLVQGLRDIKKKGHGALVVIELETGLKNYIESGVTLNSDITQELLLTIFSPKTPLHDGAVIIRNDRIIAAACTLPLSYDVEISKTLGTRHRAAIGITEISDAWAIIVSEDTGLISLARGGSLEQGIELENLKKMLIDLYRVRLLEKTSLGRRK